MVKACDLKKNDVVKLDGLPHIVETITVQTPSARGSATLYKVRFRNVASRQKADRTFRGDDALVEADFEKKEVQYLFSDASGCTFMDLADFSQFTLRKENLEEELKYMVDGMEGIQSLCSDGKVLAIELPLVVEIEVAETGPSMKGASATARTKAATLTTGFVIQVPEYLVAGEKVRVDTRTGQFVSRA